MNATGQWIWYVGMTLVLVDVVGALRPGVTLEPWVPYTGFLLLIMGLFSMAVHGLWDAWEEFEANDGGEAV